MQEGPWSEVEEQGGGFGHVPARGLTGGELEVASELEEVRAHRFEGLMRSETVDWGIPHGEVRRRLGLLAGDHTAAVERGRGVV